MLRASKLKARERMIESGECRNLWVTRTDREGSKRPFGQSTSSSEAFLSLGAIGTQARRRGETYARRLVELQRTFTSGFGPSKSWTFNCSRSHGRGPNQWYDPSGLG